MPSEAELRIMQEDMARMLSGGFHKQIVEMHGALFVEYIKFGFTRPEAIELINGMMMANAFRNPDDNPE